ncbi:hypothetical protein M231_06326 [Tremella mesenterica]|uniref:Kinesin motor domain-containing protein n=1 Tax=Tremella mesenterica TaxID=5217 RepID=A0A4Q1BED9_TREME|nr:hypothetical protein M231_06326 [Tremella mesenterica]
MDTNSIKIAVRVRPWHPIKEQPFVTQITRQNIFQGDGNFAISPRKPITGSLREVVEVIDHRALDFDKPELGSETKRGQPGAKRYKDKRYVFDHVLSMEASQEHVYDRTTRPLLDGILDGYNATVFAYGATGCGKTHTISGTADDPGIIIRTMEDLFQRISDSCDVFDTEIELSFVEIYNETIRDLLSEDYPKTPRGGLQLLENSKERVTISGVTLKRPTSVEEVMELVQVGNGRRTTHYTESNSVSSRSHAVLQVNVGRFSKTHEVDLESGTVRQLAASATLSIIDLAGSERASATRNMGARMKEGANINKSLLALSSCISSLCQRPVSGVKPHIPYRNSKLTRLLKFSLGGNCRTVMVVCVSPSSKDIEDTFNTLTWANQAKNVSTKVTKNTAGNRVNVAQYLVAIAEKDSLIKLLQAKLQEADRIQFSNPKLEEELNKAKRELDQLRQEAEAALPMLLAGAQKRAEWDGAELRISALKRRIGEVESESGMSSDEVARQKTFLETLMRGQERLYRFNAEVQAAVERETTQDSALKTAFARMEGRTFNMPDLGATEKDYIRLKVALQRQEIAVGVAAARERGYRETISQQAEALSKAAWDLSRLRSVLQAESDALGGVINETSDSQLQNVMNRLQSLLSMCDKSITSTFDEPFETPQSLPPLPKIDPSRRLSQPKRSTVPPSPILRRHKPVISVLKSPAKSVKSTKSPRKPAIRPKLSLPQVKPKKGLRWKDQAGEGSLEASKTFQVPSSSDTSGIDTSIASVDSAWEDIPPVSPQNMNFNTKPKPAILPPRTSHPSLLPPPPSTSRSSSDSGLPEWKKNRLLLGKSAFGGIGIGELSTLKEDVEAPSPSSIVNSSPESNTISKISRLGPPIRHSKPLGELHQIPSSNQPSTSSLFRPTAASAAKMNSNFSLPSTDGMPNRRSSLLPTLSISSNLNTNPNPNSISILNSNSNPNSNSTSTSSGPIRTRRESLGPTRHERHKTRNSVLPYAPGPNTSLSIPPSGISSLSALSGGAQRIRPDNLPNNHGGQSLRRMSSMGTIGVGVGNIQIGNVGLSTLPRGPTPENQTLNSKPSIGRLSIANVSFAGLAGGGDRAPWR